MVAALVRTVAIAVLGAGCAGSGERLSKMEYERAVIAIREEHEPEANGLYSRLAASELPSEECAEGVRELHERLEEALDDVEALRPPADVEDLHDEFVTAAGQTVERVGAVAGDVERERVRCGAELNRALYHLRSTRRAQRVLGDFGERGYRLGFA